MLLVGISNSKKEASNSCNKLGKAGEKATNSFNAHVTSAGNSDSNSHSKCEVGLASCGKHLVGLTSLLCKQSKSGMGWAGGAEKRT